MIVSDELISVHRHALRGGDSAGLTDDAVEQPLAEGVGLDLADLQTQNGAHGVDGRVDADLLPDELIDVVVLAGQAVAPVGVAVVQLAADSAAEVHLHAAGGGGDAVAGLRQTGAQNAGADDAALFREDLEEVVVVAQTVDQGAGDGVFADDRQRILNRLRELGGLRHVDDAVNLALGLGGSLCAGVGTEALEHLIIVMIGAVLFLMDGEEHAVLGNLLHVRLIAVDEDDVRTAVAQVGSEHAAGRAGTVHCEFHDAFLSFVLISLFSLQCGCLTQT